MHVTFRVSLDYRMSVGDSKKRVVNTINGQNKTQYKNKTKEFLKEERRKENKGRKKTHILK